MPNTFKSFFAAIPLAALFGFLPVQAQETIGVKIPENSVISDGVLTREEVARYVVVAKAQLEYLTEHAAEKYEDELIVKSAPIPRAWMLMKDGKTVKELKLDKSGEDAPANIKVVMFRAALKSVARNGQINAATILFAGQMSADNPQKVLVMEHEHRLGISASKFIPYKAEGDAPQFGEPEVKDKPFQMFYDDKSQAPTS